MNPDTEFEAKFLNIDFTQLRPKLMKVGAVLKTPERLMRRVVYGSEVNLGMVCTYGRVRDEGDKVTMSAKYSAVGDDVASQKETMVTVDSFDNAVQLLEAFGLRRANFQESKRETWQMPDGTLVELETWPHLPPYIEIEGVSEAAIQATARLLDIDWKTHTLVPTGKLYEDLLGKSHTEVDELLRDLRFDT